MDDFVDDRPRGDLDDRSEGGDDFVDDRPRGDLDDRSEEPTWCSAHGCNPYACPPDDREGCVL